MIVRCPRCEQWLSLPSAELGKLYRCTQCKLPFSVQGTEVVPVIEPPSRIDRLEEVSRREDREEHPRFRCPFCGTTERPDVEEEVSQAGWILFWMMLLFLCIPLCWIPLVSMKERHRVCSHCDMKLD